MHFLTFTESQGFQGGSSRRYGNSQERPPLEIRTMDNNTVSLDITVTYKIIPEEGHLIVAEGLKDSYQERVVSKVTGVLREELAKLRPEEFVDTDTRMQRVKETMPILAESLRPFHVEPQNLLIRAARFLESYEDKLQQKQLASQKTKLEEAKRKVADALKATGTIEKETEAFEKQKTAEWDKRLQEAQSLNEVVVAGILAEAHVYDNSVRPQADALYETLLAEGKLAVAEAEALRDELRNKALDTLGGRILQARNAAENLNFESVTLNSNDPSIPSIIEIDRLVELLVGEGTTTENED